MRLLNEVEPQSKTPIQLSLRDLFIGTAAIGCVMMFLYFTLTLFVRLRLFGF